MEEQVLRQGRISGSTQYKGGDGDINGGGGRDNEMDHYGSISHLLNGLLHSSKASTSFSSQTIFQHGQYDLILDRPSIQKWWDYYYYHHPHRDSEKHHPHDYHGVKWDTEIVMELMRVLQTLHRSNVTETNPKARKIRIISVFISMDIFQKKTMIGSPQEWSEHQQQQSNMIRTVLSIVKESLPQLQSVHLYNGQISSNVFAHSTVSMNVDRNDPNLNDGDDADVVVVVNEMITNDDRVIPPSQHENRLYHRWNRFHIDDDDDDNDAADAADDDRDDHENDFNNENQMFFDHGNDEEDSESEDTEFPVMISGSILASIIELSTLESIIVTRCLCLYNSDDVSALAKSIQHHPCLSSMHLASIYIHPNFFMNCCKTTTPPLPCIMDPLIKALSSLSQLESLNITLAKESRLSVSNQAYQHVTKSTPQTTIISPESLQQLIASTSIKDLTLWECLLNGSHLSAISNALLCGSSRGGKSHHHDDITSTKPEPKQTSLQFLSLRCNPNITCDDWCTFYTKTLPNCFSIQSIYNDHVCGLADCDPNSPQHGKTCSVNTREGLRFWDFDTTTSDETTSSELSSSTAEAAANAELFLGLNSLGRGSIIQGSYSNSTDDASNMELNFASASENDENFLDLLSDVTDTPSALYALIRSHPIMILSFIRHQS